MSKRSDDSPTVREESRQLSAAREELQVLEQLAQGVSAQITDLSRRPSFQGKIDNTELALQESRYGRLKAYEELAHRVYGRTVKGVELDENDRQRGRFTFRITQANVGYVDKGCFVLARNSALARELVTARPGDQRDVTSLNKDRYFDVKEVRTFDGPTSLRANVDEPDFRSMSLHQIGVRRPSIVEYLRSFVHRALHGDEIVSRPGEAPYLDVDPTWLSDWTGARLADTAEVSLGHEFFTSTSPEQERALNNPRGLTFVEGIAGAGKTSAAVGRLKFFANFRSGEELDGYGLVNAPQKDFDPAGMVGFVLSHSLKKYLKETAAALDLERLPIRDFEEFRTDLSSRFAVTSQFKRKRGGRSSIRSSLAWLRALDAAMARAAGKRLRDAIQKSRNVPDSVRAELELAINRFVSAEPETDSFHLVALGAKITAIVAEAERRHNEAVTSGAFRPRARPGTPQYLNEQRSLEREMQKIQDVFDRRTLSPLAQALLSSVQAHELFPAAATLDEFFSLVEQSLGRLPQANVLDRARLEAADLRQRMSQAEGRTLDDADLTSIVILAAMMAESFDYADPRSGNRQFYNMRRYTAVFIDEVQDFTETEVLLMGMSATDVYQQVTLSGDRCQRLQMAGAESYEDLFPLISRGRRNPTIFLNYNFRQRDELAGLSAGYRASILGDRRVEHERNGLPAALYQYDSQQEMADFILQRIRSVPTHATIAVLSPNVTSAQRWFDLLEEELEANHRPALMSRREDLTRRFDVHFAEITETKGLEFDVIIIPDLGEFALDTQIGRNQVYVAISRSKNSLLLGCSGASVKADALARLEREKLIHVRRLSVLK